MESLVAFDKQLFLAINGMHNEVLDFIMYWVSDKFTWVPFYILLTILLFKVIGKRIFLVLPLVAVLIVLSDQSSVFFKNFFERLRPCHDATISDMVHTVKGHCGGKFGFISSHATNTFALAAFVGGVFKPYWKHFIYLMLLWAVISSYSRVYLGVHFPADIVAGGLLGLIIGTGMTLVYEYSGFRIFKNLK